MDDKLDRIMESVSLLNVQVESLRVSVQTLIQEQQDHDPDGEVPELRVHHVS